MRRTVSILMTVVMVFLLVISSTSTSFAATPPVLYVGIEGSGYTYDFPCTGTQDHQNGIQSAIDAILENQNNAYANYNTIHLRPGTYTINDPIYMGGRTGSTITLEGEAGTIIKSADNVDWGIESGMIREKTSGATKSNFIIKGFKIDGNGDRNINANGDRGDRDAYESCIFLTGCSNIEVHDMTLTDNLCDGLIFKSCNDLKLYNNLIDKIGHDGICVSKCQNVEAYGNTMYLRINCGIRGYNSNHLQFHDNVITKGLGGGAAIQIQKNGPDERDAQGNITNAVNDVKIYNNTMFDTEGPGVYLIGYVETQGQTYASTSVNAQIFNNLIYHCGLATSNPNIKGGISSHGFNATITNNTIDKCTTANILTRLTYSYDAPTQTTDYTLTVKNNIITNSPGIGLYNDNSKDQIVSSYNDIYNNTGGRYSGVSEGTGDIYNDPLFASAVTGDYHLKSHAGRYSSGAWVLDEGDTMSPCIDAGEPFSASSPTSAYSNEPAYNGGRVNMGRYGNTPEASKMYFYMKNRWNSNYTNVQAQTGKVEYSPTIPGHSARWILVDAGVDAAGNRLYRIRNYWQDWWLNIQNLQSYAECNNYYAGDSTKWYLVDAGDGYTRFKNYWQQGRYLHIQDLLGYVQSGGLGDQGWWSAQWLMEHP